MTVPGSRNLVRPWNGVVAGFDGTDEGRCAVRWAAGHAVRHGCPLYVVRVVEPVVPVTGGWMSIDLRTDDQQRRYLEDELMGEVDECRREFPGVEVHPAIHDGRASARLAEHAGYVDADLIAVGVRQHRSLSRLVFGSTVDDLVRIADRTVVAVREVTPVQQASVLTGFSPVVVGIDDDQHDQSVIGTVLDFAFAVAAHDETEVRVAHPGVDHVLEQSEEARLLVFPKQPGGRGRNPFTGSIARTAVRRAACSVALVDSSPR